MNLLPAITPQKFSLLSIGQRGVGKTVFLAGSYLELHSEHQPKHSGQLWFDCQDTQVQENMENLLSYITRTGQYPPSTLKITKFNFSLKRHSRWGNKILSHFDWWEIPGECCNINNPDFRKMVHSSHGCCVFIDADALLHKNTYLQTFEDIIKQVCAIANLVYLNNLKYPFALILTKCDLLKPSLSNQQQIEKSLQPLTTRLDAVAVDYQTFQSCIPIVSVEGASTLKATGAAAPLLWLVAKLSQADKLSLSKNLLRLVPRLQPVASQQPSVFSSKGKTSQVKKWLGLYLFPSTRKYLWFLGVGTTVVVGLAVLMLVDSGWVRQSEYQHVAALRELASLQESGKLNQAVGVMEKLVQQEPQHLDWRLHLARLYEMTGQVPQAEATYDQILTQKKNNFKALVGKALLRNAQGDSKTAQALFAQAEQAAPKELKADVRAVAQKTLASP